jgi:hypothetical protein
MSDLAKAFAGLREAREPLRGVLEKQRISTQVPRRAPLPLQGTAKSRHPDYTAVKIFVRRQTHKAAARKWEDTNGGDFSDLVETLLQKYLGT